MSERMYKVAVREYFSGAHSLRNYKGKCEELHGHNWKVEVSISGEQLNAIGLLVDFAELKKIVREVVGKLDHKYLNEIEPFDSINPSSENIAKYIYEEIEKKLPKGTTCKLAEVTVYESETTSVTYSKF
jgi:6-pyruvoyltetrahydropterin/6-carboxytetrahydropterin synthase